MARLIDDADYDAGETDLVENLKSETSGQFKNLITLMMFDHFYALAHSLYKAMKGAGTDELTLIEILCTATNQELELIKEAYSQGCTKLPSAYFFN
ncbi:unnamed protein product [Protopolystoma xenopodis]|uniref:Annexin n=1 Tax=Protopolystoma xenopodis TaxID=117903 RepID=A0A3S5BRY5_9PLAT|nr:unnamed protein product [Protopolystoma xenopodis]